MLLDLVPLAVQVDPHDRAPDLHLHLLPDRDPARPAVEAAPDQGRRDRADEAAIGVLGKGADRSGPLALDVRVPHVQVAGAGGRHGSAWRTEDRDPVGGDDRRRQATDRPRPATRRSPPVDGSARRRRSPTRRWCAAGGRGTTTRHRRRDTARVWRQVRHRGRIADDRRGPEHRGHARPPAPVLVVVAAEAVQQGVLRLLEDLRRRRGRG